jgi:hypothetical protein
MSRADTVKSGGFTYALRPVLSFSDLDRIYRDRCAGKCAPGSDGAGVNFAGWHANDEWDGGLRSLESVSRALWSGWDAGNLAVSAGLEALDLDQSDSGGWDLDVAGSYCSVPDYVTGAPDCMMRKNAGAAQRRVRLVLFCYMSAGTPASAAMDFARANAAYAALMMAQGYDVAITVAGAVYSWTSKQVIVRPVRVKDYGQEPDASRIAFALHPAFLRRVFFALMESDAEVPCDVRSNSYGTTPYRADEAAMRAALGDDTDGERMILLPDIASMNWRKGHAAMLQELIAMTADQHEDRGEDRI